MATSLIEYIAVAVPFRLELAIADYSLTTFVLMTHSPTSRSIFKKTSALCQGAIAALLVSLIPGVASAAPNGTWLSKPQIWYHTSNNTLDAAMARMRSQRYRYVFLDVRHVTDDVQQRVTNKIREYNMVPIVWIQSPQLRSMSVQDLIHEARYADGLQVDDHFFANYSRYDFSRLRSQYRKPIFCSIQPFQSNLVPSTGCNQIDVQCYTPQTFQRCMGLADRLKAVTSLSTKNTLRYRPNLGGRSYNVFLWPHTNEFKATAPAAKPDDTVANLP
ncbi:MAG: hypothetical protein AAGB01_02030 [Cyanobacteria bacterium P01_F01_bin.42]